MVLTNNQIQHDIVRFIVIYFHNIARDDNNENGVKADKLFVIFYNVNLLSRIKSRLISLYKNQIRDK